MNTLKIAVVGCGNISSRHLAAIEENVQSRLMAVCDIDAAKAEKTAEKYGVKSFNSFDELLSWGDFDVLHICTPHYLHSIMAIAAMNAGKHVLCEKPLAIHYNDALKMCECAERNNVYLGTCFQNRYNEQSIYIKNLLDSGEMGKVVSAKGFVTWDRDEKYYSDNWHGTLDKEGGGVVINQSIHTLDLLQWFIGSEAVDVKGSISQKRLEGKVETEDTADALITFENGVQALYYGTLCYKGNSPVYLEVVCEKGRIVMYDELTVFHDNGGKQTVVFNHGKGEKSYWGNSHSILIDDFYKSINNNSEFGIFCRSGIKAVKIVDMLYAGARK